MRSVEKSRRVVGTVPPIREEQDNVPDELSILDEGTSTVRETVFARSTVVKRTPPQVSSQIRVSPGSSRKRRPLPRESRKRRSHHGRRHQDDPNLRILAQPHPVCFRTGNRGHRPLHSPELFLKHQPHLQRMKTVRMSYRHNSMDPHHEWLVANRGHSQ